MKLSFVVPCYGSEKTVRGVVREIEDTVAQRKEYDFEIILVNDSSPDGVLKVLKEIAAEQPRAKVLDLARNVGKASAVLAGISKMTGDLLVLLDDDGQCPTDHLWELVDAVNDGHDMAVARYPRKKQSWWKNLGSSSYQKLMRWLMGQPREITFSNFSVCKKFLAEELLQYRNPFPSLQSLFLQATHDIVNIPMEERERAAGSSGFTLWKCIKLLINGCTNFSVVPLRFASVCGISFSFLGLCGVVYTVVRKLLCPQILAGYSSIVSLILLIGGMLMLLLGIIGEYLGRIYICINNAPQYVIRQEWNT